MKKTIDTSKLIWSCSNPLSELGYISCPDNMLDMSIVSTYVNEDETMEYEVLDHDGENILLKSCRIFDEDEDFDPNTDIVYSDFAIESAQNGFFESFLKPM